MQQGPRHAAKLRGDRLYITGKPCTNGHNTHRYTQSGACVECVRVPTAQKHVALPSIRVRAYHDDREVLAATAYMLALAHDPFIRPDQVDTGAPPTGVTAGTGMYNFKCHLNDQDTLRASAVVMVSNRHMDTERARRVALEVAASAVGSVDTTPPINFN